MLSTRTLGAQGLEVCGVLVTVGEVLEVAREAVVERLAGDVDDA